MSSSPTTTAATTDLNAPRDGVPQVLTTAAEFDAALAAFATEANGPIAIDAERASGYRYSQRAYLVQMRREGAGTILIDPIALPDLSAFSEEFSEVEWIFHAASQDLPCLHELGFYPKKIFDTELAARLLGYPKVGLGTMVAEKLHLKLAKEHSAADWSRRPLPQDWLTYAALDVEVLADLRDILAAELSDHAKFDWAVAEFEAERLAPPKPPRFQPWRRTSGTHKVRDSLGLAIVRELWNARDHKAQELDISPSKLLSDSAIIAAATRRPADRAHLKGLREFNSRSASRHLDLWASAIERALALDPEHYPARTAHERDQVPPAKLWRKKNPAGAERLTVVKATVREKADALEVPQENLLTPAIQRALAWTPPPCLAESDIARQLHQLGARDWQIEQVAQPLATALDQATSPDAT